MLPLFLYIVPHSLLCLLCKTYLLWEPIRGSLKDTFIQVHLGPRLS
jgi:hypothetical protein